MKLGELITIKSVKSNAPFTSEKHTPYSAEIRLFSCVQRGDIEALRAEFEGLSSLVVAGIMSNDETKQYKYLAVSAITLATRYAIQGGLGEKEAYDFSDRVIMLIDEKNCPEEIIFTLATEIASLTEKVKDSRKHMTGSPHISKCKRYINENISEKITVKELARECGISPDYLSQIFKQETGENLSTYITRRKLESAKAMISENISGKEIAKCLAFSSESHFITLFKKHYQMTPTEFAAMLK